MKALGRHIWGNTSRWATAKRENLCHRIRHWWQSLLSAGESGLVIHPITITGIVGKTRRWPMSGQLGAKDNTTWFGSKSAAFQLFSIRNALISWPCIILTQVWSLSGNFRSHVEQKEAGKKQEQVWRKFPGRGCDWTCAWWKITCGNDFLQTEKTTHSSKQTFPNPRWHGGPRDELTSQSVEL